MYAAVNFSLVKALLCKPLNLKSDRGWPISRNYSAQTISYEYEDITFDLCLLEGGQQYFIAVTNHLKKENYKVFPLDYVIPSFVYQNESNIDEDKINDEVSLLQDIMNFVSYDIINNWVLRFKNQKKEFSPVGIEFKLPNLPQPPMPPPANVITRSRNKRKAVTPTLDEGGTSDDTSDWKQLYRFSINLATDDSSRLMSAILWFSTMYESTEGNRLEEWPLEPKYFGDMVPFIYKQTTYYFSLLKNPSEFYFIVKDEKMCLLSANKLIKTLVPELKKDTEFRDTSRLRAINTWVSALFTAVVKKDYYKKINNTGSSRSGSSYSINIIEDQEIPIN